MRVYHLIPHGYSKFSRSTLLEISYIRKRKVCIARFSFETTSALWLDKRCHLFFSFSSSPRMRRIWSNNSVEYSAQPPQFAISHSVDFPPLLLLLLLLLRSFPSSLLSIREIKTIIRKMVSSVAAKEEEKSYLFFTRSSSDIVNNNRNFKSILVIYYYE